MPEQARVPCLSPEAQPSASCKNLDFGSHTQPPVFIGDHFYSHYTINERSDGLVAMSMDGQVKWKTDQRPAFVRGGMVRADGLLLMTDGNMKLYLVEPSPSRFKPIASAIVLDAVTTGHRWHWPTASCWCADRKN